MTDAPVAENQIHTFIFPGGDTPFQKIYDLLKVDIAPASGASNLGGSNFE